MFRKLNFPIFESIIRVIQNFKAPLLVNRDLGLILALIGRLGNLLQPK